MVSQLQYYLAILPLTRIFTAIFFMAFLADWADNRLLQKQHRCVAHRVRLVTATPAALPDGDVALLAGA